MTTHPTIGALVPVSAQVFLDGPEFWFVEAHTAQGRYVKMHMFKSEMAAEDWAWRTTAKIEWNRIFFKGNVLEREAHELTVKPGWWTYIGPCPGLEE